MRQLILTMTLLPLLAAAAEIENFHATTRGFGDVQVQARFDDNGSWTSFQAEDATHAGVIASKRLGDLLAFGNLALVKDSGLPGTVLALEDAGMWLLGLDGAYFHELYARDATGLRTQAEAAGAANWTAVTPDTHPRWLDGFDTNGPAIWVGGGGDQYVLPNDFEWLRERRLAMCTLSPTESRLVAPGLMDTSIFDWHRAMAAKYDIPYRVLFFPAAHEWLWNREPLPYVRPTPGYIGAPWLQYQVNAAANAYEPVAQRDRHIYDARRRLAEHLEDDPNFLGMHGCTEIPDAGVDLLAAVVETPGIAALWHGYLSTELGMDLDTVGLLHKGDRHFYASWAEVLPPKPTDFIGWDPSTCIDLRGVWQMREDLEQVGVEERWHDPLAAPEGWVEGDGNDVMLLMYTPKRRGKPEEQPHYWMRRSLQVTSAQLSSLRYLHIARSSYHGNPTPWFDVWLNDTKLEPMSGQRGDFDMCYPLNELPREGENLLVFNTRGNPIPGYCFLGPTPLRPYPRMTDHENRLWFDGVNFDAWLRVRKIEGQLRASRSAEPNRPLKMMATINLLDMTTRLCRQYGAYQHDTGGAGGYWCPMTGARLARSHGFPWSSEQGGPPADAASFQSQITRYIMLGNDALDMVFGVGHYRDKPNVAAWFDQNLELIHVIGKMHLPTPSIGILRSTRATRMGFAEPWNWDIGRGALQAIGRNFAYVEVPDVLDGTIDQYPVLIDCGTVLMTPEEVEGILRYVRAGGTFVAQHHTARHLPARADAWPLAQALGLTVTPKWMSDENYHRWELAKIKVGDDQSLLPKLRGQSIEGSGVAIDYLGKTHTGAVAYAAGADDRIHPVATWEDDSSMAIVDARLGRGRLIMLGTPFYMRMRDVNGVWINNEDRNALLDDFLTALEVPRDSWTNTPELWAEIWRSKNALFDLYPVARMATRGDELLAGEIRLRREGPLQRITEISVLGHPSHPVAWQDGAFTLPAAPYSLMQSRVFIAPREDIARAGLEWFQSQSRQWHALPPISAVQKPRRVAMPDDLLSLKEGWSLRIEGEPERTVSTAAFATLGLPEDAIARFERKVELPDAWKGRPVTLIFDSEHWFWGILPHARLWIDGAEASMKQPILPAPLPAFSLDVTEAAADGTLTITLEIDGTKVRDPNRQAKPHGINGLFYLQATMPPVKIEPLAGQWFAATAFNHLEPVDIGATTPRTYLQIDFTLPDEWPAERLFLQALLHLGYLEINGEPLQTPAWMTRLDISGLVREQGAQNRLRWLPASRWVADRQRLDKSPVPQMELLWQPPD